MALGEGSVRRNRGAQVLPLLLALLLAGMSGRDASAQVPLIPTKTTPEDDIRQLIEQRARALAESQRSDGSFSLDSAAYREFPVGCTALAVLALQHSIPHMKAEDAVSVREIVRKGIAYIVQQPRETKTYSAGLAICALYMQGPTEYQRPIGEYAALLIKGQWDSGKYTGMWQYDLPAVPGIATGGVSRVPAGMKAKPWGDPSNTQVAILGLYNASLARYQIPRYVWERSRQNYLTSQSKDPKPEYKGGWGYNDQHNPLPYISMTVAGTVSLNICDEMLNATRHDQCKMYPEDPAVRAGLEWCERNLNFSRYELYELYTIERLGILMGRSDLAKKDWFQEGAKLLVNPMNKWVAAGGVDAGQQIGTAFGLLFLARGLEPVIFHKLERPGQDWDLDHYDVKHLVEFISERFQQPKQWRIVSLEAPEALLQRVPTLYVSGHDELKFTSAEKDKLRNYVDKGGVLFGTACCAKPAFDASFRKLVAELWPDRPLAPLPEGHPIYNTPLSAKGAPKLQAIFKPGEGGKPERLAVIYSPTDLCCRWHAGGDRARDAFAVGANIYFFVNKQNPKAAEPVTVPETTKVGEKKESKDDKKQPDFP